jgi:hypothetical protein
VCGESVFEPDPHREDVGLALGKAVDRVPQGFDRTRPLGLANRVLFVVVGDEVSEHRTIFTNRCLERHRVVDKLCLHDGIEGQTGLFGELLRSRLTPKLGEQTVPGAVERHQRVVQ